MKNITKGALLLTLGLYLAIVNPIMSALINKVFYLHYYPSDPLEYLLDWLLHYGILTFVPAALGLYLIFFSWRYFKKKPIVSE